MSQERMLKLLTTLGIGEMEARLYLYLVTEGPRKGKELSEELNVNRHKIYQSLKRLRKMDLVRKWQSHPAFFTAVTIEEALDSFRDSKLEEAQLIRERKDEFLSSWRNIRKEFEERLE